MSKTEQVSNPEEPRSKKGNEMPCNSELAHGMGYTGFPLRPPIREDPDQSIEM